MELSLERKIKTTYTIKPAWPLPHTRPFPWVMAILISAVLFLAENQFSAGAMDDNNGTDLQASILQGNLIRQIAYPFIGLIGIVWLFRATRYRLLWRSPLVVSFGLLLGWCVLSVAWAQEPAISIRRIVVFFFMMTCAAGAAALWSHTQSVMFISLSGAAHLTIGALYEIATGRFAPWNSDYRFAGTLEWNVQGFCCLLLALSSLAASDSDSRYKAVFRSLALYGLAFLILTKSRSSMVGAAAGLLVYYLLTRSLAKKTFAMMAFAISALLLCLSEGLNSSIAFLTRNAEGASDLTGRIPLWKLAATFVNRKPMTGYGYQGFWTVANVDYFSSELHWTISAVHNGYLETVLTLGYIGLCLHVLALIFGVSNGCSNFKMTRSPIFALAAAIFAVLVVVGWLEVVVLWKPSPYNFGIALLLWTLCLQKHDWKESRRSLEVFE
jgi:exopolysaccharide production protein ExoQ